MIVQPLPMAHAIPLIVRRHAEEVATRWWRREAAYIERRRTLFDNLADFDETIDAHLDGLLESGSGAMAVLEQTLADDAPDLAADLFAAYALAWLLEDEKLVRHILLKTDASPGKAWALEGVLAWSDVPLSTRILQAHLHAPDVRLRAAALAQCHAHGFDGADLLGALLAQAVPALLPRLLRTVGECARHDLLPVLEFWCHRAEPDSPAQFWASWSAIMLGQRSVAMLDCLKSHVAAGGACQRLALRLLCLVLPAAELGNYLQQLAQTRIDDLLLLEAIGWSGNVWYVPWLIGEMRKPARSRMAGEALRLITGLDLDASDAVLAEPASADDAGDDGDDPAAGAADAVYPLPDSAKVAAWWQANQSAFDGSVRLLLGQPLSMTWLDILLNKAEQSHRELAAVWRVVLRPGSMLLPTAAHAMMQWRRLQNLKENPT